MQALQEFEAPCPPIDGRFEETRRLGQALDIEVHIVSSSENPGGMGEPGGPPVAAAVANAVFAATGKRLRRLPIAKNT